MGIKEYVRIFKRHKWWIVGWFVLLTLGYGSYERYLKHIRYVSTASFEVKEMERKKTEEESLQPQESEFLVVTRTPREIKARKNTMESKEVMIRAFALYLEKARANADKDQPGYSPFTQAPYPMFLTDSPGDDNIKELSRCIKVRVLPEVPNTLEVSAESNNKYKTLWMLEAVIKAYSESEKAFMQKDINSVIEKNQTTMTERQEQRKTLLDEKRLLRNSLSKRYGEHMLWEEGTDSKLKDRSALLAELSKTENEILKLQSSIKELEGYKPEQWMVGGGDSPLISEIQSNLYRTRETLQQELAALRVDFTDKHPKVVRKLAEINSMNAAFPKLAKDIVENKLREFARDLSHKTSVKQKTEADIDRINKEIQLIQENKQKFDEIDAQVKKCDAHIERLTRSIEKFQTDLILLGDPIAQWHVKPQEGRREAGAANTIYYVMVFGILIGCVFAYLLDYLDDTIHTAHDVEKFVGLKVIGTVPMLGKGEEKLLHRIALKSPISEMMNTLAMILQSWMLRMKGQTMLIVSSKPGEGKSTFSTNLAVALCRGGEKVLLMDADMRKPSLHRFFGVDNSVGLSNYLEDSFPEDVEDTDEAKIAKIVHHTDIEGLFMIPSGPIPTNPVGLLKGENVDRLLNHLKTYVGIILVDTPPLAMIDAGVLATKVDAVVTMMDAGKVSKREALAGKHLIENVGGNNIGVILNKVTLEGEEYYYYFEGYSYYYGSSRARKKKPV